jgi:Fe2+ transport system protein B
MRKKYFTKEERLEAARRYNKKSYQKNTQKAKERSKKYREIHKERRKDYNVSYYKQHKEKIKENANKRYQDKKEEINEGKRVKWATDKDYRKKHSEKVKKYITAHKIEKNQHNNQRKKIDINYRLACCLRTRLWNAIKYNQKIGSAVQDLGCSVPELKTYLESKFQEGMTWENWSRTGWHIDHIIPLDSFNLQNREEFLKACHYTNLQPMWAEKNISKRNKC